MRIRSFVTPAVLLLPVLALAEDPAGAVAELVLPAVDAAHSDWQPTGELATLLEKMRASTEASQKVYGPLTAEQLNWRPPNGTHTPRWNVEHITAAKLLFFSQVYATIDPDHHEMIRINPKQKPDDYVAAHSGWSGAEEVAHMERVGDYVQGFAYLLEGVDLDSPAPGSRWTPRRLLQQMDRHHTEHTANVKKKFELPGWPAE